MSVAEPKDPGGRRMIVRGSWIECNLAGQYRAYAAADEGRALGLERLAWEAREAGRYLQALDYAIEALSLHRWASQYATEARGEARRSGAARLRVLGSHHQGKREGIR